jgi:hypothetical protein
MEGRKTTSLDVLIGLQRVANHQEIDLIVGYSVSSIPLIDNYPIVHCPCYFTLPRTSLPDRVPLPGVHILFPVKLTYSFTLN